MEMFKTMAENTDFMHLAALGRFFAIVVWCSVSSLMSLLSSFMVLQKYTKSVANCMVIEIETSLTWSRCVIGWWTRLFVNHIAMRENKSLIVLIYPKRLNSLYRRSWPTVVPRQTLSGKPKSWKDDPTTPRYTMSGFHNKSGISATPLVLCHFVTKSTHNPLIMRQFVISN